MINNLKQTAKETTLAILPICVIITIISLLFKIDSETITSFITSSILLIIGISLFTFGADISMMIIGEKIGNRLIKNKNLIMILLVTFIIGILITVAEPDLRVLATQITSIPTNLLIVAVGVGVGIFLMIAALKILFKISLRTILLISYSLVFLLLFFVSSGFIPIAFDSSGVTTGPISVPFILALGLGFAASRTDNEAQSDTFGLIGLCAIGPKVTVLILGMIFETNSKYDTSIFYNNFPIVFQYMGKFLECIKEISISLLPIIAVFILFKLLYKDMFTKKDTRKITIGFISTFLGLTLFLTGVNVGFMKTGFLIGENFINKGIGNLILPFGMILGFLVILAEPAVKILTEGIENKTEGSIPKKAMLIVLSFGVAIAILISLIRSITGISILYFIIPGYIITILLMFLTPKTFTAIAFDAGGSVCGPLTATFILPMAIGACLTAGNNIITDAFGLIALVALSPLLTVQLLGIIFKQKTKQELYKSIDEEIIDYDWRCIIWSNYYA